MALRTGTRSLSDEVVLQLKTARGQLHLALEIIDRSGEEIAGAQLQMAIDAIAVALLRQPHDND